MKNTKKLLVITLASLALSSCVREGEKSSSASSSIAESSSSEEASSSEVESKLPYNQEVNVFSYSFPQLGKTTMPIGAWCAPWAVGDVDHQTEEQYALVKESGLNTIYGLYEEAAGSLTNVKKGLQLAADNDLVYLARDSRVGALSEDTELLKEKIGELAAYSSYGGAFVTDEPGQSKFAGLVSGRKAFRQYYSKYLYYANLFPNYATVDQLSGTTGVEITYEEYLRSYLETVQPQILSFDFYGMRSKGTEVSSGYYEQLYICSKLANEYKVPFWPFIQACTFSGGTRVPTRTDILWQVGSNLVYGAKGIQYFCYMEPYETSGWEGNFVDRNGKKTALFPYFQEANAQIANMDEILMVSSKVAMMQFGESPAPFNEEEKKTFVTSCRELSSVDTSSDLLIGVYDHGGKSAYYVFNNSLTEEGSATLNFSSYVRANVYEDANKREEKGEKLTLTLEPGESILVDLLNY